MKQYTITIELPAESEKEAFETLKEAFALSSSFSTLRHKTDTCYVEEYDEEDLLGPATDEAALKAIQEKYTDK